MAHTSLPYFDYLLSELAKSNTPIEKPFGKHVHLGYWQHPADASCSGDDYARAAENLTIRLCDTAQIDNNQTVLDAGCGFGGTISYLNARYSGMQLTGLNIDGRQLTRASQQVSPLNHNQIHFVQGDACNLPFANDSFDQILAIECIFHFPNREVFLREARRVLKPKGRITLSDFIPNPLFLPVSSVLSLVLLNKSNVFGRCDIQCTLARYGQLAVSLDLSMDRLNVTRHTLPTYRYLKRLIECVSHSAASTFFPKRIIDLVRLLGSTHLLTYQVLTFNKVE